MKTTLGRILFGLLILFGSNPLFAQHLPPSYDDLVLSGYISTISDRSPRFDTTYTEPEEVKITAPVVIVDESSMWKEWSLVDNFSFGKNRGDIPMIADLNSLHPYFRDKIILLIERCRQKGIELTIVESYRTRAKQAEYYGMGRKYTRSKGGRSKHQYGLACDLVPVVNGEPQWEDKLLWKKIGTIGESLGLRWGGRWRSPYDPAHFEWTGGSSTYELEDGTEPVIPNSDKYPCLSDDLDLLRKHWNAWEAEQSQIARGSR